MPFRPERRMTFKPMTYLVSFTAFVLLFMGLGGWVGYTKLAEHFLAQAYLEALPIRLSVQRDEKGAVVRWQDKVALPTGVSVGITASNRAQPILIQVVEELAPATQPSAGSMGIPLAANERTEDVRLDRANRYLYARVFATSTIPDKETTWLYKYDLEKRQIVRRTSVNPILLPSPFRP
jgi:hypothetical protein